MAVETKSKMEHKPMKKRNARPRKAVPSAKDNLIKSWNIKELLSEYSRIKSKTFNDKDIKMAMLCIIRDEAAMRPDVGEYRKDFDIERKHGDGQEA
jgi:hypothetical protein